MSLKLSSLLAVVLGAGGLFLVWTMTWLRVELQPGVSTEQTIEVTGETAVPSLLPLALALLALTAALAIAGGVVRRVLGVVVSLLGAAVVAGAVTVMAAPESAVGRPLAELTGLEGSRAIDLAVTSVEVTALPVVTVALGVAIMAVGVFIATTSGRWSAASARYRSEQAPPPGEPGTSRSAVSDWDSLSAGDDPTGDPGNR